ncbi:MAG: hypothetical protein MZW92_22545 [Comamonadaceae bacterium]|nr:hypothetical protein [Comamonadaceae bacterium]
MLATGDPLCHGIAAFLASRLCIEAVEILPNASTIQLASRAARSGLWQDLEDRLDPRRRRRRVA